MKNSKNCQDLYGSFWLCSDRNKKKQQDGPEWRGRTSRIPKKIMLLTVSHQGSIFSGQSGRSRGTVLEEKAVTFQVRNLHQPGWQLTWLLMTKCWKMAKFGSDTAYNEITWSLHYHDMKNLNVTFPAPQDLYDVWGIYFIAKLSLNSTQLNFNSN